MFSNVKILENNVKRSFSDAKTDINELKNTVKQHSEMLKQLNDNLRQLHENQKTLLIKIKDIEKKSNGNANGSQPIEYIGSAATLKVHDPVCPFAKNIKPKNRIVYKVLDKAFNDGYKPCNCLKKV